MKPVSYETVGTALGPLSWVLKIAAGVAREDGTILSRLEYPTSERGKE
jgi:hypothetical protein